MKITCQNCYAEYNLPSEKIPSSRQRAKCNKCGGEIIIDPAASHKDLQKDILVEFPELTVPSYAKCNLSEILVPNKKGAYKTSRNKNKVKILKAVGHLLNKLLVQNEQVLRVGQGVAYYPSEIFFGNGFLTMLSNYYAILATNRRLLFININSRATKQTHYLFQLPYENIKKAKYGRIFGRIIFTPVKGKRRTFNYIKRFIVKEFNEFLTAKLATVPKVSKVEAQPENICPSCFLPVETGHDRCPHCDAAYKTPIAAFWRSLLLPGWGDIYLGHRGLGTLELIGSLVVWGIVLAMIFSPDGSDKNGPTGKFIIAAVILFFYNGSDGIFTYFMGKKGYMLVKK